MSQIPPTPHVPDDNAAAAEKVRSFPHTPGVYLMKDAAGRVIYIGKAKDLRAGPAATSSRRPPKNSAPRGWCGNPRHRLPRRRERGRCPAHGGPPHQGHPAQVQPRAARQQDLSLPGNLHPRGLSPRGNHPHAASRGARNSTGRSPIRGRFAGPCKSCKRSSSSAPARWTSTTTIPAGAGIAPACWRPIGQCTAPCNFRISREEYRKNIHRLQTVSRRQQDNRCSDDLRQRHGRRRRRDAVRGGGPAPRRNPVAGDAQRARPAGNARAAGGLSRRSEERARRACRRCSAWPSSRGRSRASTSPTPPAPTRWPAWCSSSTVCPSSRATGGCGSAASQGVDDVASIHEAVLRRFHRLRRERSHARHPPHRRRQGAIARGHLRPGEPGAGCPRRWCFRWPSARS